MDGWKRTVGAAGTIALVLFTLFKSFFGLSFRGALLATIILSFLGGVVWWLYWMVAWKGVPDMNSPGPYGGGNSWGGGDNGGGGFDAGGGGGSWGGGGDGGGGGGDSGGGGDYDGGGGGSDF